MPRVIAWVRQRWRSIGGDLNRTMLGLMLFTAIIVFVVLGYAWTLHLERVQKYGGELLATQFQIPIDQVQNVLRQAETRAETSTDFSGLNDLRGLALFSAVLLIVLPILLAWWAAQRFARPLSQLSQTAHRLTIGDFSARVNLNKNFERREDETALLLKDFNSMAASLERLEHERRYGVAAIAHELRTPVTVLRGRLEGVRDGVLATNLQEFEKLIGHADLLAKLINDLQLLSLAEAGELRLERNEFVMQDFLKLLHADHLPKAEQKQIELKLHLPSEPARVNADPQRLYQVFSNLLNNALRHTPAHGSISIRLAVQTKTLVLEVQDSGAGFTPEAMTRAFERFYRSPDRGRQRGGSGLGLAISRSLIKAHGGQIELVKTQSGACVRVTLDSARD
jgi:signal transduction histidine kinase